MFREDKGIFLFSITGLAIFAYLSFALPPHHAFSLPVNQKIPGPDLADISINNVSLNLKPQPGKQLQYILFNRTHADTVAGENSLDIGDLPGSNRTYLMALGSAKTMPPVGEVPYALALGIRYADGEEASACTYLTRTQQKHAFKVISIFCDPENVFGFDKGIYIAGAAQLYENARPNFNSSAWWLNTGNWSNKGKEWERPIHFQLMEPGGKILYENGAGLRINGNATRGFAQKSLRLTAAKKYGGKKFRYSFFGDAGENNYKALVLRNGGNDWGRTMFADRFIQSCLPADQVDRQEHVPVVVYLNGLYWGIYSLCEKLDENYLAEKYQVSAKKITLLEGEKLEYGSETERDGFAELVHQCKKGDLSDDEAYRDFCSEVDINNFALFVAIQLYCVNTDLHNENVYTYRIGKKGWKWILRDLDCAYSYSGNNAFNTDMFAKLMHADGAIGYMLTACMKNKDFRSLLKNTLEELLAGSLNIDHQLQLLETYEKDYAQEIQWQINRWRKPVDKDTWKGHVNDFREFIRKRGPVLRQHMNKYLDSL